MSEPLTAATIRDRDIAQLREEAVANGDDRMVDCCDVARSAHRFANADGEVLVWPFNGLRADRDVARKVCADAINAARAMTDPPEAA